MVRDVKNFGSKLNATTLTLLGPLSPGLLDPGLGTMYPLNPPLEGPASRSWFFSTATCNSSLIVFLVWLYLIFGGIK